MHLPKEGAPITSVEVPRNLTFALWPC